MPEIRQSMGGTDARALLDIEYSFYKGWDTQKFCSRGMSSSVPRLEQVFWAEVV